MEVRNIKSEPKLSDKTDSENETNIEKDEDNKVENDKTDSKLETTSLPFDGTKKDVPLPKIEFLIYLSYWFIILFVGMHAVYKLANNKITKKHFRKNGYYTNTNLFNIKLPRFEIEWLFSLDIIMNGTKYVIIYVVISRLLRRFTNPYIFMIGSTVLSIYLHWINSSSAIIKCLMATYFVGIVAGITRFWIVIWVLGLALLYKIEALTMHPWYNPEYLFNHMVCISAISSAKLISIGMLVRRSEKWDFKLFLETMFYFWYFPAIFGCRFQIINEVIEEIYQPKVIEDYRKIIKLYVKTLVYSFLLTVLISYIPYSFVVKTHNLSQVDKHVLMGGQMYGGVIKFLIALCYITYGDIWFRLDGFSEIPLPHCICRIALYSAHWRSFDVALHYWIKDEIFRPISRFSKNPLWRYFAAILSFGYVWLYHGLEKSHACYVWINCLQYFLEKSTNYLYHKTKFGETLNNNLSPVTLRRLAGLLGGLSFQISIFAFANHAYGHNVAKDMYYEICRRNWINLFIFCSFNYVHGQISKQTNDWLNRRKQIKEKNN